MIVQQQSSAGTPSLKRADIRWIRMYLRRQLLLFEGILSLTARFHLFTVHCTVMSPTHILYGISSDHQVNMNTPRSPPNLSAFSFLRRPEGKAQAPTKHSTLQILSASPRYISTSHDLSLAPRMPQQNKRPRRVTASSFALLRLTFSLGPATLPAAELSRACALLGTWSSAIATLVSVHLCWMRC